MEVHQPFSRASSITMAAWSEREAIHQLPEVTDRVTVFALLHLDL